MLRLLPQHQRLGVAVVQQRQQVVRGVELLLGRGGGGSVGARCGICALCARGGAIAGVIASITGGRGADGAGQRQAQRQAKGAADAGGAVELDAAGHQRGQPLAQRQPQPHAAVVARHAVVGLVELLEQARLRLGRNADALVLHLQPQRHGVVVALQQARLQRHLAALRELDRVVEQAGQDLPQPHRVAAQVGGQVGVDVAAQLQALDVGARLHALQLVAQQGGQVKGNHLDGDVVGLAARQVQDVVDELQQVLGGVVNRVQKAARLLVLQAVFKQRDEAQDVVHGRAQFVAHVGQEGALGAVGALGGVARGGQLAGARLHQLLQVLAVQLQLARLALQLQLQPHARAHHLVVEGLVDEIDRPGVQRLRLALGVGLGGDEDDGQLARGGPPAQLGQHLVAVHAGHHHVQQHQVGHGAAGQQLQRVGAAGGKAQVAVALQHADEELDVGDGVVHHQHGGQRLGAEVGRGHGRLQCWASARLCRCWRAVLKSSCSMACATGA